MEFKEQYGTMHQLGWNVELFESISGSSSSFSSEDVALSHLAGTYGGTRAPVRFNEDGTQHLKLSWENINVWCAKKTSKGFWKGNYTQRYQILDNVNGSIKSGCLTAIMGPSGAGKTSLLAAVSMRVQGDMSGSILLNGYPITKKMLTKISGFVPQDDLVLDSLTVMEHMLFMASMKMDRHVSGASKKKRVKEILREMGLSKCSRTKINAISGGEKRRLSLAVQLINDPPILFCDEPTTGLDSFAAATVVAKLRAIAESGRAVLCVLHQPASDTFQLFHKVILLANGRMAYHGVLNGASVFFRQQGFQCPVGYNEAEYLVNVISSEPGATTVCSAWQIRIQLTGRKERNNGHQELSNGRTLFKKSTKSSLDSETQFQQYLSIEKPSACSQFYWLVWRSIKSFKNNWKTYLLEFLALMVLALIISIPYQNIFLNVDQRDIQNIQGLLYLIVTEIIFTAIYTVFHTYSTEVPIFLREVANDLYTPGPYYLSKVIFMVPKAIIEAIIYTCLVYLIVGFDNGFVGFLIFTVPVIFATNGANAYGAWLSTTFESIETASLVSVPIDFITYLFVGNFINLNSVGAYIGWMKYLSVFFYSAEAISILQWNEIHNIACDPRPGLPCMESGVSVLRYFGFRESGLSFDLLGLLGIYLGFHVLAFISLWRRSKRQPVY